MLKLAINGVTLSVKYLHKAKGRQTYNYRRLVPSDLRQHYAGREIIKSLKTSDPTIAVRECQRITREVEAEFLRLRSGLPKAFSESEHGLGLKLLRQFGIQPQDTTKLTMRRRETYWASQPTLKRLLNRRCRSSKRMH